MYTVVIRKVKSCKRWYAYKLANVFAWCPVFDATKCSCNDWVSKLTNYLLQQFLHYSILFCQQA